MSHLRSCAACDAATPHRLGAGASDSSISHTETPSTMAAAAVKPAFLLYNTAKVPYSTVALASQCSKIAGAKAIKIAFKATEKGTSTRINNSEEVFFGEWLSSKYFARMLADIGGDRVYGTTALEATQIDAFVALAEARIAPSGAHANVFREACAQLNAHLAARTFLVGATLSLADYAVWSALVAHPLWAPWQVRNLVAQFS